MVFITYLDGKWGISYEKWPWANYPVYLSGATILLSSRTIRPLLAAAQTIPFMPFDDAYLTGLCAEKANISLHGNNRYEYRIRLLAYIG